MRKIFVFLPLLALSLVTQAQTNDEYASLFNKIDALINNYIEYSTLNTVDHPVVTDASKKKFISLFTSENAIVDYDLKKFIKAPNRDVLCYHVKKYCEKIAELNPSGLKSVKLIKSDIDYTHLSENKVRVLLEKKIGRISMANGKPAFGEVDNTVMLTLIVSGNMSEVKIDSIIIVDPIIVTRKLSLSEVPNDDNVPVPPHPIPGVRVPKLYAAIDVKAGTLSQSLTAVDFTQNYKSVIAANTVYAAPHFSSGGSFGFDAQLEYYFGKKANIGLGAGFAYFSQKGTMQMDNFHVEYQSEDFENNVFRQVINAHAITEQLKITNMNIPIVLKYKTNFNKKWGFAADAGVLFNIGISNSYTTNAAFDYGAVYAFNTQSKSATPVYDPNPTPLASDWIINSGAYHAGAQYSELVSQGYNVGAGKQPTSNTGTVKYSGSIGFIVQPALTYQLSKSFFLDLGVYYMSQKFSNTSNNNNYMITNKIGDYNSMLNSLSGISSGSFGVNIGVKISLI